MNIYLAVFLIFFLLIILRTIRSRRHNFQVYQNKKKSDNRLKAILNLKWEVLVDDKYKMEPDTYVFFGKPLVIMEGQWEYTLTPTSLKIKYGIIEENDLYCRITVYYLYRDVLNKVVSRYKKEVSEKKNKKPYKKLRFVEELDKFLGI